MHLEKDQWLTVGAIAGLLAAFAGGVWWPQSGQRAQYEARAAAAEAELGIGSVDPKAMAAWHEQVEDLRTTLASAKGHVPSRDDMSEVLTGLTRSMTAFGVTGPQVQVREAQAGPNYHTIPFMLEFEGTFPAAYGVVKRIEAMPRLIRIDELELQPVTETDATPGAVRQLEARLRLSTFYSTTSTARTGGKR